VTAPRNGLPPRIYLPILLLTALVFLGVVGYFLRIGLGVTGAALGPAAQGDSTGGAGPPGNGVGGGTPVQGPAGAPPAPVQRLLVDLRGRLVQNPRDLSALVGLAQLYFDAGKFERAGDYYRRALAIDPANPDTRTDYATALHAAGRNQQALDELALVLAAQPNFAPALYDEGVVAAAIGRRREAIAAFHKFLRVAPHDSHADQARSALRGLGV
jgi:cytochrome c-type biogenesis protein CcmH/NrfG